MAPRCCRNKCSRKNTLRCRSPCKSACSSTCTQCNNCKRPNKCKTCTKCKMCCPSCDECVKDCRSCNCGCGCHVICDPEMLTRISQLLTHTSIATYYVLVAFYVFGFCAPSRDQKHVAIYSVMQMLPTLYLASTLICASYVCQSSDVFIRYVVIGLFITAFANSLLIYDPDNFMTVVGMHTVVLMFYIGGLTTKYRGACYTWLYLPLHAAALYCLSKMVDGYLSILVIFCYGSFMGVYVFLALARYERERTGPAYLGAAGALLLAFAHALYTLGDFAPTFVCVIRPELTQVIGYMATLFTALSSHFS